MYVLLTKINFDVASFRKIEKKFAYHVFRKAGGFLYLRWYWKTFHIEKIQVSKHFPYPKTSCSTMWQGCSFSALHQMQIENRHGESKIQFSWQLNDCIKLKSLECSRKIWHDHLGNLVSHWAIFRIQTLTTI